MRLCFFSPAVYAYLHYVAVFDHMYVHCNFINLGFFFLLMKFHNFSEESYLLLLPSF